MKKCVVAFLFVTLSWTKAFIFFAKPAFAVQPDRHISHRSIKPMKPNKFSERTVPNFCQPESVSEGDSDSSELEWTNPVETEPVPDVTLAKRLATLTDELNEWENKLRTERIKLNNLEDKLSESGKNGYYLVQAQLQDFRVSKLSENNYLVQCSKHSEFLNNNEISF